MKRANHGSRYAAPDWSKLLKSGAAQTGRSATISPTEEADDPSRPISRASSSYFLAPPSKLGSRQSSTTSLNRLQLSEQPTWQTADIEEFLQRRSTDAEGGAGATNLSDFEEWVSSTKASTSYQLPMFTLPAPESRALQPQPSSAYERSAEGSSEEVLAQLRALQRAAAALLAEQEGAEGAAGQEGGRGEDEQEEEEEEEEEAGQRGAAAAGGAPAAPWLPAAGARSPLLHLPAGAAGASPGPSSLAAAGPLRSPAFGTPRAAAAAGAGGITPGRTPGSARRAAAVTAKPAGTPAYGCITTPASAVVTRQAAAGSAGAARSGSRTPAASAAAAAAAAADEQGVSENISEHLQQLKLLQRQAEKLFG